MSEKGLAVIFDMDGVMVRTGEQHYAAWKRVFAEEGLNLSKAEFLSTFGMRNPGILRHFLGEGLSDDQVRELAWKKEKYYRDLVRDGVEPAPGLLPLLQRLKAQRFRVAVGTSAPRENVELILSELGIESLIDVTVIGADVKRGKPYPDVFLLAAERCSVPPERCVVIEDAPTGLAAAKAAGMRCIAVTGTKSRQELAGEADLVVDSLEEVSVALIQRLVSGGRLESRRHGETETRKRSA